MKYNSKLLVKAIEKRLLEKIHYGFFSENEKEEDAELYSLFFVFFDSTLPGILSRVYDTKLSKKAIAETIPILETSCRELRSMVEPYLVTANCEQHFYSAHFFAIKLLDCLREEVESQLQA